jgi:hypothetical protein
MQTPLFSSFILPLFINYYLHLSASMVHSTAPALSLSLSLKPLLKGYEHVLKAKVTEMNK